MTTTTPEWQMTRQIIECGCLVDNDKQDVIQACVLHTRWRMRLMNEFMNYTGEEDVEFQDVNGLDMDDLK
jgi:hypothetical protein